MQYRHDPGQTADETTIRDDFEQCLRCLTHEDGIDLPLPGTRNLPQFSRESTGCQSIGARQQEVTLSFQPFLCNVALAFRTMTIPTGVVDRMLMPAFLTKVELPTKGCGATVDDIPQHLAMGGQYTITEAFQVSSSGLAKDIREFDHLAAL